MLPLNSHWKDKSLLAEIDQLDSLNCDAMNREAVAEGSQGAGAKRRSAWSVARKM